MDKELRAYEEKLIKELEETKFFSWKRLWKTMELSAVCSSLSK